MRTGVSRLFRHLSENYRGKRTVRKSCASLSFSSGVSLALSVLKTSSSSRSECLMKSWIACSNSILLEGTAGEERRESGKIGKVSVGMRRESERRTRLKLARVDLGPVDTVENLLELLVLVPQLLALGSEAARLEVVVDGDLFGLGVDGNLADDCA